MRVTQTTLIAGVSLCVGAQVCLARPGTWDDLMRRGGIVVDHQPIQSGGPAADTEFIDMHGNPNWALLADDILLPAPATIRRVNWWGFYGDSFAGSSHNPPTGPETMRVRFYGARPGDGLPDDNNILYEESFLNPSRTPTGLIIAVGGLPAEFFYEVGLSSPMTLDANTPYWLEIVQIGDIDSAFRWEFAFTDQNDFASRHANRPEWALAGLDVDLAFELSTVPEPGSFMFLVLGFLILPRRSAGRGMPRARQ